MKILIIKFRNIGDVLLLTPLIKNLKLHYPTAQIDIAINSETTEMVTENPNITNILSYNRQQIKSLPLFKRITAEMKYFLSIRKNKYNIAINTTNGDRGLWLAYISGATKIISYKSTNSILNNFISDYIPPYQQRHIVEAHLDILRIMNIPYLSHRVELFWNKKNLLNYQNFIHIHPVSRWLFKCIEPSLVAKIIDYCELELNQKVILTASSDSKEIEMINLILAFTKSQPINLSGKLSLKQTAALNNKAKFFIGVDTAIMHIAAANDIPTLAFFVASAPFHWGPWDNELDHSNYCNENGIQKHGKHTIFVKNAASTDKQIMNNYTKNGTFNLENIDFETIKKTIIKQLSNF